MHQSGNEVAYKVVYYGPGLSGKTTNLRRLRDLISPEHRGKLVTLCTRGDRTVFFDFLPVNFAKIGEYNIRLHLYSVPGQAYYSLSRKVILEGVDAIIFVADSQIERIDANLNSLDDLEQNLKEHNLSYGSLPIILQLNKRDLPAIMSVEDIKIQLGAHSWQTIESVALGGTGPIESLKMISKSIAELHAENFST